MGFVSGSELDCFGGPIPFGHQYQLNVRTAPGPTIGMGGEVYGGRGKVWFGPYGITGP